MPSNEPSLPMPEKKNVEIKPYSFVANRSAWRFLKNIGEFHLIKPNRFLDLLEKIRLSAI